MLSTPPGSSARHHGKLLLSLLQLVFIEVFFPSSPLTLFKSCSLISLQLKAIKELSEQHPFQRCLQGTSSARKLCLEAETASGEQRESGGRASGKHREPDGCLGCETSHRGENRRSLPPHPEPSHPSKGSQAFSSEGGCLGAPAHTPLHLKLLLR